MRSKCFHNIFTPENIGKNLSHVFEAIWNIIWISTLFMY